MQFGPCHFIFGMYILNNKFSDTLSPYASLMVSDKVSHELFISIFRQDETWMWAQHSNDLDMTSKIHFTVRRLLLIAEDETEKWDNQAETIVINSQRENILLPY